MNNISINTADALRHMMTLGDVRFVPVIKGGIIHYSIEWVGVSMTPVDEATMPRLDIEVPPGGDGFPSQESWPSPVAAVDAYWDIIQRSSICSGNSVLLARDRCWVMSMACEWIDVSANVLPLAIKDRLLSPPEIAKMEWNDDLDDDEEEVVVPPTPFVVRGTGLDDDEDEPQVQW